MDPLATFALLCLDIPRVCVFLQAQEKELARWTEELEKFQGRVLKAL